MINIWSHNHKNNTVVKLNVLHTSFGTQHNAITFYKIYVPINYNILLYVSDYS